ncbi:hypothetical protein [Sorangium sp. So ce128]|uniref:hypothetical protein n=1 Tax=Sorangium sp. So ce128 TaxID=3133281 RepID=UPI003F6016EA
MKQPLLVRAMQQARHAERELQARSDLQALRGNLERCASEVLHDERKLAVYLAHVAVDRERADSAPHLQLELQDPARLSDLVPERVQQHARAGGRAARAPPDAARQYGHGLRDLIGVVTEVRLTVSVH